MRILFLALSATMAITPTLASRTNAALRVDAKPSPSGPVPSHPDHAAGAELFSREWVRGDPRSAGGAGLGADANAPSCVACHALGGVGGAGGLSRNVSTQSDLGNVFGGMQAMMVPVMQRDLTPHPDGVGPPIIPGTARNPPALFGSGLIDRVPDEEIRALAARPLPDHPEITGRVSETTEGEVGRFAWKGHVPSLTDFVVQACEVELGLAVDHPARPGETPKADLQAAQVTDLIAFVGALPAPEETAEQPFAHRGEEVFREVGCDSCHVESVGPATRLFSDLLLHDMGPGLSDAGFGYAQVAPSELVAAAQEWRTPPLWGLRDSAPYLHDGRASTLEAAIRLHDGEAAKVVAAWRARSEADRAAIDSFLRSLTAPK